MTELIGPWNVRCESLGLLTAWSLLQTPFTLEQSPLFLGSLLWATLASKLQGRAGHSRLPHVSPI